MPTQNDIVTEEVKEEEEVGGDDFLVTMFPAEEYVTVRPAETSTRPGSSTNVRQIRVLSLHFPHSSILATPPLHFCSGAREPLFPFLVINNKFIPHKLHHESILRSKSSVSSSGFCLSSTIQLCCVSFWCPCTMLHKCFNK